MQCGISQGREIVFLKTFFVPIRWIKSFLPTDGGTLLFAHSHQHGALDENTQYCQHEQRGESKRTSHRYTALITHAHTPARTLTGVVWHGQHWRSCCVVAVSHYTVFFAGPCGVACTYAKGVRHKNTPLPGGTTLLPLHTLCTPLPALFLLSCLLASK